MLPVASQPKSGCHSAPPFPKAGEWFPPRAPLPTAAIDPHELAKHRPQLLKFAMRELRNAAQAEDAVQETLLAALQGAERFRGGAAVRTWLTGILKHKIIDHHRRGRREVSFPDGDDGSPRDEFDAPGNGHGKLAGVTAGWGDPEIAFAQDRFFEVLERGIARLPENTARAFRMREIQGMSTDEVSQALGITASHCAVLLYRARMSLRDYLQKEWFADRQAKA